MTADSGSRTPKRDGGLLFNITASLDYDCVVVAGNVHILGQCAKWSFWHEIKAYLDYSWRPTVKRGMDCRMDTFHRLTRSESML